ncbi:MAG: PfkB family carbohydrate kinase [bacterium]|nr:PfkB family carbohydrate kinase [bacterium]
MKQHSYTAIGDIGVDVYPQTGKQFPGGMALNNAIHATRAGAQASIISAVGDDRIGKKSLKMLQKEHINIQNVTIIPGGETQSIEVVLDDHKVQQYQNWNLGVMAEFIPSKIHEQFISTQDAAISFYLPEFKHFFEVFAGMNVSSTIKIADFTDLSEHHGDTSFIKQYIPQFNWYIFSIEREGREGQSDAFEKLMKDNHTSGLALLGSDGSMVIHNGKKYLEPAQRVKVVDTTGAGDSYVATFFVSYLQSGDLSFAMKQATKSAALTIQKYGAI